MNPPDNNDPLFERLAPPPGGLGALRSRLDEEEASLKWSSLAWKLSAGAATAALAVFMLVQLTRPTPAPVDRSAMVALGLAKPPSPLWISAGHEDEAVSAVALADPKVIFYRVGSASQ